MDNNSQIETHGVIEVEKRSADYRAHLRSDRRVWSAGKTPNEAIGDLWRCHHEEIEKAILEAHDNLLDQQEKSRGEPIKSTKIKARLKRMGETYIRPDSSENLR